MDIVYFDNSATTQIKKEVLKEMFPYLCVEYGNPSSIYTIGRSAKRAIEIARVRVASLINCLPEEVYFTSCGTESNNTALKGIAHINSKKGNHIITSKIEHPSVLNTCKRLEEEGYEVSYINVDENGIIKIDELISSIRKDTILISIMFANNEIGSIQPIKEIGEIAKKNNIIFHTDAVQAVGNINVNVREYNIDMLSLSGHKIYAPKGVGVLYVKKGIEFQKYLDGGHQEKDLRAGTENVASIVGLGKASKIAEENLSDYCKKLKEIRDYCYTKILENFKNIHLNGGMNNRLPGNLNISFEDIESSELLYELDEYGICASGGSACSSGNNSPSHVLTSIGLKPELTKGAIRFSFGDYNTKEQVDYLIYVLKKIIKKN